MTHKDDASALPGSAPQLAALADPVYNTVDGGVFDELGTRFTEAGGKTAVATNKVKSVIGNVDGAWDGASADSFVNYMNGFTAAGMSVTDALTNAASDLRNAGGTVQGARDALEGVFANLVTEVQAMDCPAEEGELEKKVNEVVERYRPQVTEQLELAGSALTDAASAVSGLLDGINPKFSTMSDPNTGTFAPSSGEPLEWIPAVPEQLGPGEGEPGGGETPGGTAPGGVPGGETPGGTPGGGPPGGEAPGEEVPPGAEGPPGEAPGGERPNGETEGKILDVARDELGYEEGPGNENKYGPSAAWCSSFATWVWRQSGVDIPSLPFTGDVY
ncbi:MAG TPA: WXG100 family type VII secretion target, partial [Actinophytocola sp.]|nr:WXG100 family type VII secretion target [Actinophytocola sp.]